MSAGRPEFPLEALNINGPTYLKHALTSCTDPLKAIEEFQVWYMNFISSNQVGPDYLIFAIFCLSRPLNINIKEFVSWLTIRLPLWQYQKSNRRLSENAGMCSLVKHNRVILQWVLRYQGIHLLVKERSDYKFVGPKPTSIFDIRIEKVSYIHQLLQLVNFCQWIRNKSKEGSELIMGQLLPKLASLHVKSTEKILLAEPIV